MSVGLTGVTEEVEVRKWTSAFRLKLTQIQLFKELGFFYMYWNRDQKS